MPDPTQSDLLLFQRAIFKFLGKTEPKRSVLNSLGQRLAKIAKRRKPWGGAHLYVLLHADRYPKYKLNPELLAAALQLAKLRAHHEVTILTALSVQKGALVLCCSRRCALRKCGVHFVPKHPNQRFCSKTCALQAQTLTGSVKSKTSKKE